MENKVFTSKRNSHRTLQLTVKKISKLPTISKLQVANTGINIMYTVGIQIFEQWQFFFQGVSPDAVCMKHDP